MSILGGQRKRLAAQNTMHDPPATETDVDLHSSVRLALVSGIGPRQWQVLIERFGTPQAVLAAPASHLRDVPGIGPKLSQKIAAANDEIDAEAEIALCRECRIEILTRNHSAYPRSLAEIADPPALLFMQGALEPADGLAIAIVGARHATHYGLTQAERLAGSLARAGLTVISGLARGIDAAAHRGALAAGGRTLAVLGSGVLNIYPPENRELAFDVRQRGALLSEAPPRGEPLSGAFPQRNRIISGMSMGVVVVEASSRSGALITARHASEQGRDVFAVPGRVDSRMSQGCHRLIRDGAKLVETADDILEELGPLVAATSSRDGHVVHHPAELLLNEPEQRILAAVDTAPTSIDQIISTSRLPAAQVLSTISVLEMRRLLRRVSGNLVVRP
ncbi:MAG TPA: DNA-processing protein DprA [Pirellulales bacterium]|nr:DNA-processing protein DprA [Pirellulales bacterium]